MMAEGILKDQVAVVTGASRGIGKAVAFRLAEEGAHVALVSRRPEGLEKVISELRERFPQRRVLGDACDVASSKNVTALVDRIVAEMGRLDILVNNAGITRDNLLLRMSEEEWDEVMETNLKGLFNFTKAAARQMLRAKSGRIINVTSVVGMIGNAGQANYAASKGGVI